jgi:hypothetical protein
MPKKTKANIWINFVVPLGTFLLGLVATLLFEKFQADFIKTETRIILVFILIQGFLIVIGLFVAALYLRTSELQGKTTVEELDKIRRQIGLSAQFIFDFPRADGTGILYKKATELVFKAETEILILHHNMSNVDWRNPEEEYRSDEWKKARGQYYQALLSKCNQHRQDTFFYRRILQIPESKKVKDGVIKRSMIGAGMALHCTELLQFIKQNPETALLKYSPVFLPQTLVLIDERFILWEVDAIDPDAKAGYMDALTIFDDTDGNFVKYLKNFYLKIDAQATKVKSVDLES